MDGHLGDYANPDSGILTLKLADDQLLLTDDQLSFALRPLKDQAGIVTVYLPVDPPFAASPTQFTVTLEHLDGRPRMTVTAQGDGGESELVYPFVWEKLSGAPTSWHS